MNSLRERSLASANRYLFITFAILATFVSAQLQYQGCYTIDDTLSEKNTSIYQSTGLCSGKTCGPQGFSVFGLTSGSQCWCGDSIPPSQVDPMHCNIQCPGYPQDNCGGNGYLAVYLTGEGDVQGGPATTVFPNNTMASKTASAASNTVYVSVGQTTIIQTPSASSSGTGGVSGGAAAGIVIGVLTAVAIGAGVFFYLRRRRRGDLYERQFEGSTSGTLSRPFGTDQRLEPSMVQRRESAGSLADERDYSRKILRVSDPRSHFLASTITDFAGH